MIKIDLLKNYPNTIPALAHIWHEVLGKIWMPGIGIEEIESLYHEELEHDMRLCSEDNEIKQLLINDLKEQIERFSAECHDYRNEISDLEEQVEVLRDVIQSIRYECDRV